MHLADQRKDARMSDVPQPTLGGCLLFIFLSAVTVAGLIAFGLGLKDAAQARRIQVCELETQKIVVVPFSDLDHARYSTDLDQCR